MISTSSRLRRAFAAGLLAVTAVVAAMVQSEFAPARAQTPPVNGMRPADPRAHAITDATVVTSPGAKIEHATILIRKGVIEAVGPAAEVAVPPDARIWPGEGLTVYAGFIDPAVMIKAGDPTSPRGGGAYWNPRIHPEIQITDTPGPDKALRKELRSLGFAAAAVYPANGALRGTGAVLALADEDDRVLAYQPRAMMAAGFDYGGMGRRGTPVSEDEPAGAIYPGSLIGAVALLRQAFYDAQWHAACRRIYAEHPVGNEPPVRDDAMAALDDVLGRRQAVLFETADEAAALRADRLAREFNLDLAILGSGTEFRHLDEIKAIGRPFILPLEFPKRPEVSTLSAADGVSLRDLMTWEQAPTNPRRLVNAGVSIALTTHKLKSRADFPENLRAAVKHGLTEEQAIAALTTSPAKMLGLEKTLGTIEPGKAANLVVVKGSIFDKKSKIRDAWVNGRRYEVSKDPLVQLIGGGTLKTSLENVIPIDVDTVKSSITLRPDKDQKFAASKVVVQQDEVSFVIDGKPFGVEGYVRMQGVIEPPAAEGAPVTITGTGDLPGGKAFTFVIEVTPKPKGEEEATTQPEAATTAPAATAPAASAPDALKTPKHEAGKGGKEANEAPPDKPEEVETQEEAPPENSDQAQPARPGRGARRGGGPGGEGGPGGREKESEAPFVMPPEELNYPLGEYGRTSTPKAQSVLIEHATIWTSGPQGVIHDGSMLVIDGKIAYVGNPDRTPLRIDQTPDITIDAHGRRVTPGLIDCHSHTGVDGSVNEFAQTNTAEVRIGDCIDSDDINWYRELAGGLTAANQLHGSANPIGGQNSVVKLKFGAAGGASAFPIADAVPGIKFALGENVKRDAGRYPNTRMGVEAFYRDAFTAAKEYKAAWDRHLAMPEDKRASTYPPRRDLEMDALVEILDGGRIIHCHSYRQDEILMLIRVADSFGFKIGTFQHVLEGYKVADAIARHGAGGSTFSDWWAYKVEVMDAIPWNGALMSKAGVLMSFNSDSDELARRLNTEAAKAVRYGGLAPEEALKFVTINPAKQLRIDHRTGSLEAGKDADFVIWSGDPLSTYTRCEQTWIEGACYFSLDEDQRLRTDVRRERQRIIQKILTQAHGELGKKKEPASSQPATTTPSSSSPAESRPGSSFARMLEMRRRAMEEQVRRGCDPEEAHPGDCGCDDVWSSLLETSH